MRRLPSGRYQVRYRGPDGRPRTAGQTFERKSDADRCLAAIEHSIHAGAWSDPKARAQTLATYADEWLSHRTLAVRTRELYVDLLRLHIKPQLGGMPLGSITALDVRRWHKDRSEATDRVRTGQAYGLLRTILGTAVRDGLLPSDPCQISGAGSVKSPERPHMSREHAGLLIDALPPHVRAPGLVTLLAHLRLGELLALRMADVDLAHELLHVRRAVTRTKAGPAVKDTKTGHSRAVHLPPEALEALRSHLAAHPALPSAPLFLHPSGRPLTREHVRSAWDQARRLTGLTEYHWHDLRHAGLTWFAEAGGTVREVMHRGGHKSVAAAMIYQHRAQEREAMLAARLTLRSPGQERRADSAS